MKSSHTNCRKEISTATLGLMGEHGKRPSSRTLKAVDLHAQGVKLIDTRPAMY